MEYENMRVPELKSLARDRELRNYSRMGKTELVALLQNNGTPEGLSSLHQVSSPTSTEVCRGPGGARGSPAAYVTFNI